MMVESADITEELERLQQENERLREEVETYRLSSELQEQMVLYRYKELSEALERYHDSSEQLRSILRSVRDPVIGVSGDGAIDLWNQGAEQLFGYAESEAVGQNIHKLLAPVALQEQAHAGVRQFRKNGKGPLVGTVREVEAVCADGTILPIEIGLTSYQRQGGWHAVGVCRDLRHRKEHEQTQQQLAYQSGMAEIAATVLHNVGNVVQAMTGHLGKCERNLGELQKTASMVRQLVSMLPTDAKFFVKPKAEPQPLEPLLEEVARILVDLKQQRLQPALESLQQGMEHITEVLHVQREMARGAKVNSGQGFPLEPLLEQAVALFQEPLQRQQIQVEISVADHVPALDLPRNPLQQAVLNLLKNALEAICERKQQEPEVEGWIRIQGSYRENRLYLSVSDNGVGVAPEFQDKLFRFGESTKRAGSGMGLHSVANFVQSQQGGIQFQSEGLRQGSLVQLTFPLPPEISS